MLPTPLPTPHCLGFAVNCATMFKGIGVVAMGFILFVGSIYLLLTAIFGRYMAYLVVAVAFFGWLIIQSSIWAFGYKSQGPVTPVYLGPKGAVAAWVVLDASNGGTSTKYTTFAKYPGLPWKEPDLNDPVQAADVQSIDGAITTYLAAALNTQLKINPDDPTAIQPTAFTVNDGSLKLASSDNGTQIAVGQAQYIGGGPLWTVSLYFDDGSEGRYSFMFLFASILLFGIHIPLLDRAEKKRKAFLTGGDAPAWYGPA
jgi:hypothetical protein